MSSFDFRLQLLDANRMRYRGRRRNPSFWIENASIEWKEAHAPFFTVGRLTLLPKSQLTHRDCEALHIDVTENSTPESAPLGSINRARSAASRQAGQRASHRRCRGCEHQLRHPTNIGRALGAGATCDPKRGFDSTVKSRSLARHGAVAVKFTTPNCLSALRTQAAHEKDFEETRASSGAAPGYLKAIKWVVVLGVVALIGYGVLQLGGVALTKMPSRWWIFPG